MPPRSKGARLWLRPQRVSANRKLISRASWIILDGGRHIATGCAASEIADAEGRLSVYIAAKYLPKRKERDIEEIDIADVLSIYLDDCGDLQATRSKLEERIGRLNAFWGANDSPRSRGKHAARMWPREALQAGRAAISKTYGRRFAITPRRGFTEAPLSSPCPQRDCHATAGLLATRRLGYSGYAGEPARRSVRSRQSNIPFAISLASF